VRSTDAEGAGTDAHGAEGLTPAAPILCGDEQVREAERLPAPYSLSIKKAGDEQGLVADARRRLRP